jgi:hypothetical protein
MTYLRRRQGGPLAKLSGQWCNDPQFRKFLIERGSLMACKDSEQAASLIRHDCGITSRAQLDTDNIAAQLFHKHFREPYMQWLKRRAA